MKIGILHLSDLHIESDIYLDKVDAIVNACGYDSKQISHLYIVITGDIVKFGRKEEYDKAKDFLLSLQEKIKPTNSVLQVKMIIVPGNHDCCFDDAKSTRKTILKDCLKDVIEENDYFNDALAVQDNFWNFYKDINGSIPTDKISYSIEFTPYLNNKIVFHCYNSSWMSEIKEEYGGIVIPENKFIKNENGNITISVFHHPLNWLSPNTKNNNRARFEEHLINSSNIVLFGHEHDKGQFKNIQQKNNNVVFSEGKAFQKDKPNETGFNYFNIDLNSENITCKVYSWNENNYSIESEDTFTLQKKEKRVFTLTDEFSTKIDTLKIPLKHSRKENLGLSDVFIFPDLEPIKDDDVIQYTDSKELLEKIKKEENLKIVIEGDDQSGKTTLLFSFYKNLYDNGFLPIYIRGKYINSTDVKDIVKKAIKEQYNSSNVDLVFQQHKRVLLFDNLQNTALNPKYKANLLKNLDEQFDYAIITTSNSTITNLAVDEINVLKGYDKYKLLPLGYEKRGKLIEQWLRIGENVMTLKEEHILQSLRLRFDEVNALIGNRLMPSYPIFILTILQGLDTQIFQDFSQTSYAHCYHALITAGLVKEGLKDELTSYFHLLKELAFFIFDEKKECFSYMDFQQFFFKFKAVYFMSHTETKILQNLTDANILKFDDEYYTFSYKYIFYYLVAQKIAVEIDQRKALIENLCNDIHLEKNANILIFLSHHTKAQILLESIVFTSWLPFENVKPITLESDDPFSKSISTLVQNLQEEMKRIEERNPDEEFNNEQKRRDTIERANNHNKENSNVYEMPKELVEINQALQTIKILGQIVKNQKGDFEKQKLIELVEAAYGSTFRLINFFGEIFNGEKESIIEAICDNLEEKNKNNLAFADFIKKISKDELKKQISKLLKFLSYSICIDGLNNLVFAVGSQGVDELYDSVTEKIDSSAAKIVTFVIKSYYGTINVRNLETLFKDVEKNPIAQNILRFFVKKHLYTNHIERTKREKIIQIAGFKPNLPIRKRLN
jgi:predicted MPP superfamily phosphohydrolase/GTPase SAR1 family protein